MIALVTGVGCQEYRIVKSESTTTGSTDNPTGGPTATTDTFNVKPSSQATKADILFVIDNSGSMADEQTALANAFDSFITQFVNKGVDYHIGIISTDSQSYSGVPITNGPGTSPRNPFYGYHNPFPQNNSTPGSLLMRNNYPASPNYLTPLSGSKAQIVDMFKANATLGTSGSGTERVIYNALQALDPLKLGGENAGFRRADAMMSIIGVTDENEDIRGDAVLVNGAYSSTESQPQDRIDRFKAYMPALCGTNCPGWRVDLIVDLNAAQRDTSYPLVAYSNGAYPYPDFYKKFAAQTGSQLTNIYSSTWGANLASIANGIITQAESQFKLSYAPLSGTLKVFLNGAAVANNASNGYTFDLASLTITLHGSTLAASPGKVLKVEYLRN